MIKLSMQITEWVMCCYLRKLWNKNKLKLKAKRNKLAFKEKSVDL